MANSFFTPDKLLPEAIRLLENSLVMGATIRKDFSSDYTTVGDTINIRRPTSYIGQDDNLDITGVREDIQQATVPIEMDKTKTIPIQIGAKERTFDFDRFSQDIMEPAMVRMADTVETHIASQYSDFYHFGGTPGTPISTFRQLAGMGAVMTDGAIPKMGRVAMHGTEASAELADGLKGVYVEKKAKTAFEEAKIGRYGGFDNYETVYAPTHRAGVATGTPLVNGANQDVSYAAAKQAYASELVVDGFTASTTGILKKGDIFTIAGVNAVNPVSFEDTGRLQTFVVKEDVDSVAGGAATLTISPPIIVSDANSQAYRTVSAVPADNAAITVKTSGVNKQSLLMHPSAMTLVTRPIDIPSGQGVKTTTKSGNYVTVSCTEFVDGNTLAQTFRFDMLFKAKVLDPRLGARYTN